MANPQMFVEVVTTGAQAAVTVVGHGDNVGDAFGDDEDFVIVLNSSANSANAAITDVLVGTPVTPALAVNSAILSNTTEDGDILFAVRDGDHSKGLLKLDGSEGTVLLDGNVGIGTTAPSSDVEIAASDTGVTLTLSSWDADTVGSTGLLKFTKSASATVQTFAATGDGEWLGTIGFYGSDSSSTISTRSSFIDVVQDGSAGSTRVASYMSFGTGTNSGAAAERMRIHSTGEVDFKSNILGITNVGASGSDWTASALTVFGSGNDATTLTVGVPGTGDGILAFSGSGLTTNWHVGVDNNNNDLFVIGTGVVPGTNRVLQLSSLTGGVNSDSRMAVQILGFTATDSASAGYTSFNVLQDTLTLAGQTTVTTLDQFVRIGQLTVSQSGGAVIVNDITGLGIQIPTVNTNVTGTDVSGLRILNAGTVNGTMTNQHGLYVEDLSSAVNNYQIKLETLSDQTNDYGIDMGNNRLVNVGASGNDWDATGIEVDGSAATIIQRNTTNTSVEENCLVLRLKTTNDMADGFAPQLLFQATDSAATNQSLGTLRFERDNNDDNTGLFVIEVDNNGTFNEGLRLTNVGVLSVDLGGSGSAAQVDVFDDYDDPVELQRYTHMQSDRFTNADERQISLDRMVDMGVVSEVPGASSGYHMNLQPMMNLLAGGIYQNRERMDAQHHTIDERLKRIEQALGV
jgi:hypothetical protein